MSVIMKKYKIELTKKQLSVIQEACEFMSRFSSGQLDHLPPSFDGYLWKKWYKLNDDEFIERRQNWERYLYKAKEFMFDLPENASLGIGNEELIEEAKVCYDIYRPILELQDKEYKEEYPNRYYSNVYSHPGLTYSKEGRINIEVIDYDNLFYH